MSNDKMEKSDALVFFGATGDLAFKQIFPALQALTKRGRLDMPIVGVGRNDVSIEELTKRARESIEKNGTLDKAAFEKLAKNLRYAKVDFDDSKSFESIKKEIPDAKHPLNYVALPPSAYEPTARSLASVGLNKDARLALEKPFGNDLASAKKLSQAIHEVFPEEALFRIDHFLGKETVENIVYFRAANPLFEDVLSQKGVSHIEITMAESFGVEGRAKFYEAVGALRDVVQNHLLELTACLMMDLPTEMGHEALREARTKLLSQIKTIDAKDIVRGQVEGYRDEKDVAKDSQTETFAAVKLFVDTPRWKGVPVHIRAGKAMATTATQAIIHLKPSKAPVLEDDTAAPPNRLRFSVGKNPQIALDVNQKKSGEKMIGEVASLVLHRSDGADLLAYERLIGDALIGDRSLFPDEAGTFETWRVVENVLDSPEKVHPYKKGSWGPTEQSNVAPPGGFADIA